MEKRTRRQGYITSCEDRLRVKSGRMSPAGEDGGREDQRRVECLCLPGCLGSAAPQAALGVPARKHLGDTGDQDETFAETCSIKQQI